MKFLVPFLCALLLATGALAESLPDAIATEQPAEAEQTAEPAPLPAPANEGELQLDFAQLSPDDPLATPIAVDPIDKPTPTPAPTPNYYYETYTSDRMGVSFSIPDTWLLNPNTDQSTTIQFVEPQSEMMDKGGYQTRITIERVDMGLTQTADDALARLQQTLTELESSFTTFTPNNTDRTSFGKDGSKGHYCYYRAEYNDGTKTYSMRGRIIVFAHERSLYQVRLTAPSNWYSYYEWVYRTLRSSFKFI